MKRGGLQIAICWLDHCAPDEKGRESGIHGRDSMARIYRVRTRDTLRKIAERFYRETECLERLALYNGILDPDRIWVGQSIEIPLSWEPSTVVRSLYCHSRLGELFAEVFSVLGVEGLRGAIRTYGGCFNFRSKRSHGKLSTHSWGISIDLNPETNWTGGKGDMDQAVVNVFRSFGFKWGGDWSYRSKDPMHFQFCTGY